MTELDELRLRRAKQRLNPRKNRKKQIWVREHFTMIIIVVFVAAMFITAGSSFIVKANNQTKPVTYKYYTEVRVDHGDTLWEIASNYISKEYDSMEDYMEEVKSINSMFTSELFYGQRIAVPYYSDEQKP